MAALEKYGRNVLTPAAKESALLVFLRHLCGLFNLMLIFAGILSFIVYAIDKEKDTMNLVLGAVLLVVTFLNAGIEFFQEYKSSQMLESFMVSLFP